MQGIYARHVASRLVSSLRDLLTLLSVLPLPRCRSSYRLVRCSALSIVRVACAAIACRRPLDASVAFFYPLLPSRLPRDVIHSSAYYAIQDTFSLALFLPAAVAAVAIAAAVAAAAATATAATVRSARFARALSRPLNACGRLYLPTNPSMPPRRDAERRGAARPPSSSVLIARRRRRVDRVLARLGEKTDRRMKRERVTRVRFTWDASRLRATRTPGSEQEYRSSSSSSLLNYSTHERRVVV